MRKKDPMPTFPVEKADRSILFEGDSLTNCRIVLAAAFKRTDAKR
jgi:hypothetical protein